jgi:hypothetical protein
MQEEVAKKNEDMYAKLNYYDLVIKEMTIEKQELRSLLDLQVLNDESQYNVTNNSLSTLKENIQTLEKLNIRKSDKKQPP